MKKFLIILVVGAIGVYGLIAVLRGPAREFTEALLSDATQEFGDLPGSSYLTDQDRDGLSDAKEAIYGTNATKFDTDDDGFSDGEEVRNGFDPTVPGQAKITDNEILMANLTVQYFEWAREVSGVSDPQLNDEAVQSFLETRALTEAKVPSIQNEELNLVDNESEEALRAYFTALAEIQLPEITASFIDIADEVIREQQSAILDEVIAGLDATYTAIAAVPTPPRIVAVHRGQLGFVKALRNLFVDLYSIDTDPVLLVRDINWGNDLLLRSLSLERERREIAASLPPLELEPDAATDTVGEE